MDVCEPLVLSERVPGDAGRQDGEGDACREVRGLEGARATLGYGFAQNVLVNGDASLKFCTACAHPLKRTQVAGRSWLL
eukprot:1033033-Amphidinium_carterae.1